ncbi:PipA/GogA/GtgA family type III secretion system effector [Robbsia sp. Bb-Pol-6]|uniref:PipA/GogA/GtgA family type III secretion system effector n=1 Tax=Robbsia betulipollinis TaxID=2981849 RepID=A0ABT3ZLU8_9BURK|nr:PipA/GogA/GtgA family type III secretion system effector [Robbsia betulipollinis]MCY0387481.1 PipA/GogA/GtgA family type III secretion system effector [Robbsia betulipollinis]
MTAGAARFRALHNHRPRDAAFPPQDFVLANATASPDTRAFSRLSGTSAGLLAPPSPAASARTVWTHDLEREASKLTQTPWQTSRQTLGDDLWASAGVAAWWALRYAINVDTAASRLHRARAFAYGAFDVPASQAPADADGASSRGSDDMLLDAWVRTRIALASVADRHLAEREARAIVMQEAENACRSNATPIPVETLYLLVMADDLPLQYDVEAIRRRYYAIWNPSLALRTVAYGRCVLLPAVESVGEIEALPAAVQRGIDIAALLFFTIESDARQAWAIACAHGQPSRAALRGAFAARMPAEKRDVELLDQLFQPTAIPGQIHHDGITLRNALGRTFEDLLTSEEMRHPLGMDAVSPAHRRQLLARKFVQFNLSILYPLGSVRHAIATTVERISSFLGEDVPPGLHTDTGLLEAFRQARRAWADADDGLSSADLLLAGQLAAANGVRLETAETLRAWFDRAIAEPFRAVGESMRAEGVQGPSPLEWLTESMQKRRDENRTVPFATLPYEYQWAIDLVRRQKERIARNDAGYFFLEKFADSRRTGLNFAQIPYFEQRSAFYKRAFLSVDPAELTHEILLGETWQERGEASLAYANERMFATYGAAPTIDLTAIAVEKLYAAGLNSYEAHAARHINIHGSDAELCEPITGSYVDAFLHICAQVSNAQHFFIPSGKAIHPLELLAPVIEEFNARLPSDSWVRVAALETFRSAGTVPSSEGLQDAIAQIVQKHRILSAGEILLKEILDVRNLIPLYASTQAIRQGFTQKRYYAVLFGVISMAAEISSITNPVLSIGGAQPFSTAAKRMSGMRRGSGINVVDGVSAFCSWPPSITAFKALKPWEELTHPPERLFDADLRLLPIRDRRPVRQLPETRLPWGARASVARARDGDPDVTWNGFDVIFCPQENTTFLARPAGPHHYAKIDWLTLQPAEPPEFIRQDENGEFHSIDTTTPLAPPLFGDSLLNDRPTIRQITALLDIATDATPRNFRRLFDARFDIRYTAAAQAFRQAHPSRGYALPDLLEDAYMRSTVARRVFHHFVDTTTARDTIPVSIDLAGTPRTVVSQNANGTVTAADAIVLPADRDDASLRYQSVRGIEPPALIRTVLHEFFHAWTLLPDPAVSEARHHRGAVVWLTEATLRQMEHPVHPRIAYGLWEKDITQGGEEYQNTVLWSGLEDRLIEQRIPALGMFDGLSKAYGVPVEHRVTVNQVLSLLPPVANADAATASALFISQFESLFKTNDARPGATPAHQTRLCASVRILIRHCAAHSPLMQRLLAAHPVNATQQWQFRMDVMPRDPDRNVQQLYEVNVFGRQVTFLSGPASYLSRNGIRPVTLEMRILDAAIAQLTEKTAPSRHASPYLDRGAVVWLSDRILEESGYDFPKRLHRALLFDRYGTHRQQAMAEFARARWAAEIEDRYIAGVLAGNRV